MPIRRANPDISVAWLRGPTASPGCATLNRLATRFVCVARTFHVLNQPTCIYPGYAESRVHRRIEARLNLYSAPPRSFALGTRTNRVTRMYRSVHDIGRPCACELYGHDADPGDAVPSRHQALHKQLDCVEVSRLVHRAERWLFRIH